MVRISVQASNFSLYYTDVQNSSGADQASCPTGTGESSLEAKRPGRETDHSPSYNAEVENPVVILPLLHTSLLRGASLLELRLKFTSASLALLHTISTSTTSHYVR
jgi:hypothetical protein